MRSYCLFILLSIVCLTAHSQEKPQVILLTDIGGDPDDEQSLVRLLLYSDQLDLKALCATSRLGHGHDTKPELLEKLVNAYGEVYPNLRLHSSGYPEPEYLKSLIKNGQGDPANLGAGYDTEASRFIEEAVDKSSSRVHVVVWGGQRELAQALWRVRQTRSEGATASFCRKIQVHAIGDQDKHRDYILNQFKDITYVADGFIFPGNFGLRQVAAFRGMYMTGDVSMQDGKWVAAHVHGHGPLSACYPVDGHGTAGMKEGDTPSFLGLIRNGLNIPEKPEWGGWGGRFRLLSGNLFIDAHDFLDGTLNERHTVARWRPAFQSDFMARLDWCTAPYSEANHAPVVVLNGVKGASPLEIKARPGETLSFDASESMDPDGDQITFRWYVYNEISGGVSCPPLIVTENGRRCSLTLPEVLPGNTLHLILEVSDSGTPTLTSYRRVVVGI